MTVYVQKLKTLFLMQILLERTDENHVLNANELCQILENVYGISAERKSIYSEVETLQAFGLDIVQNKGTNCGYYIGSRQFELPELKLLVDAVQASKFITEKKSAELIQKLETFTSKGNAEQLQRQVFIYNRIKSENETIYYNVDVIHTAILNNRQIQFQYAEWTKEKKLRLKKNGSLYVISPWALTWNDENYYLIAYEKTSQIIKHYRVDKMQNMTIVERKRLGKEQFQNFDLGSFSKKTFGMYGGYDQEVVLLCHETLAGVVLDRFGSNTWMRPIGKDHIKVRVLVSVSRQFFGWVTGIGEQMKIVGPEKVRREYEKYLEGVMKDYR